MIMKSDILDIIFEKRNKLYGAYDLRKFYPNRMKLALGFMFITAAAFSAFTLLPKKNNTVVGRVYDINNHILTEIKDKPKETEKKTTVVKAEKKPAAKATPNNQKQFTNNFKIVPANVITDSIATLLPTDFISSKTVVTSTAGIPVVEPGKVETGGGTEKATQSIDKTTPMDGDAVDVLPAYPGGMDALRQFLQKHLQTPDELEAGQSVSVRVKFVVDYTGKLKSFVTVLDGGDAYNKEVVRVLKKMPDWTPGKTRGEKVSVYYVIPVKFETTD
jgi:protein TonB